MSMVYDASHLVFTGVIDGLPAQSVHAAGTVSWDAASSTGSWLVSVPFLTYSEGTSVDLGAWVDGNYPSILEQQFYG